MTESTCTESSFVNKSGKTIFCRQWNTDRRNAPRALVFISHGLAEHCGWYDCIAEPLTSRGLLVFAHDHIGHGKSGGSPVHITDARDYVADVVQHVEQVKAEYPDVPVYIIGHSMGGMIATVAVLDNPKLFAGLVLIGPLIIVDPASAGWFMETVLAWVSPRVSHLIGNLIKTAARALAWVMPQVHVAPITPEWICRDKKMVEQYEADPLNYHKGCKASTGAALLQMLAEMEPHLCEISCPLITFHGGQDKLCSVEGAQLLHSRAASTDKTLQIVAEAYHQVHNEPDGVGERCITQLVDWILARC